MKNFQQFIEAAEEQKKEKADPTKPTLSDFEATTKELPLGSVLEIRQVVQPDPKLQLHIKAAPRLVTPPGQTAPQTFFIVKDEEHHWHEIENFHQEDDKIVGTVKPAKFSTDGIVGAQQVGPGLKPGSRIDNVLQLAVLPDGSLIEFAHKLLQSAPETFQKVAGLWYKADDPKGYPSELFDSHLEHGTWIWKK